jgi:dinuclear metal center YbgI/SA1388 family protein
MFAQREGPADTLDGSGAILSDVIGALDAELSTLAVPDYPGALNGLQFGNRGRVLRIATAVDASRQAIAECARRGCNLLIVHHGLFWAGAQPITGVGYEKVAMLIEHDIAVYSSHLPLDIHPTHGNNALLARALSLTASGGFGRYKQIEVGLQGNADESTEALVERVKSYAAQFGGTVRTSLPIDGRRTRRWAICSGSGASSETIAEAVACGVDTLITGEGPHHTTVGAMEQDLCIVYAGHYATETLGVQSLGDFVSRRFGIPSTFLFLPTGS